MVLIKIEREFQNLSVPKLSLGNIKKKHAKKIKAVTGYQDYSNTDHIPGMRDDSLASRICYRLSFLKSIR